MQHVLDLTSASPYLLQVVELHGYLSEEEVDVRTPLHGTDEIRLCVVRGKRARYVERL